MDAHEKMEYSSPSTPTYPYGLCISLCQDQLDKLGMEEEVNRGDILHMHCLAEVTSVSTVDNSNGKETRVELQITHISAEDEDLENVEEDKKMTSKLYLRR